MLDGLTGVLGAAEEHGVSAGGCAECQLIEGDNLTASLQDASASGFSHTQRADAELGDLKQADIVSDAAHQYCGLILLALHEVYQLGEGERRAVNLRHKQSLQNNLVEVAVCAAHKEAVKLQEEREK